MTKVFSFLSFRGTRNHTRNSTKIDDKLCGIPSVISPFGRNDKKTTKKSQTPFGIWDFKYCNLKN
ncbi:hypothetical protein B0A75_16745 [Flavobacterium oncorhynchi]|uniref:Uncharacterized protein n=1 Tax=Flavobacterium oncorhynchi TaxID=728056 RepID=A0A226HSV3_9FLAO|nr:hypothetical protein B0A75_16745 [Flavobacterium oncorhynchi]